MKEGDIVGTCDVTGGAIFRSVMRPPMVMPKEVGRMARDRFEDVRGFTSSEMGIGTGYELDALIPKKKEE